MDKLIVPSSHAAGYSNIPVAFRSNNVDEPNFKYIINICWNAHTISSITASQFDGELVSTVFTSTSNNFKLGDKVFIFGTQYAGYYTVINIIDPTRIQIDLEIIAPFTGTSYICNYYNYYMPADPQGICKVDLANTLKDFVSSTLKDNFYMETPYGIFDGSSTRFEYFIVLGEQYKYELRFADNGFFTAGALGFYNPAITSLSGIPFQIGDQINVKQDLFEWIYQSTYNASGKLGFTSTNVQNYEIGDIITITGQATHVSYNGMATVIDRPDNFNIVVDKNYISLTSPEGGKIFGTPKPEYNTDFTITNIDIDGTLGLIVETNGVYTGASQPIPGTITYLYDTLITSYSEDVVIVAGANPNFAVFDARIDRKDFRTIGKYTKDQYKDYYTLYGGFGMSTILDNQGELSYLGTSKKANRIDLTTKSFLLLHSSTTMTSMSMKYTWYTKEGGTLLGTSYLESTLNVRDIYVPVGVVQLLSNTDRSDSVGFDLSTQYINIGYYEVVPYDGLPDNELANPIKYVVDCCGTIDNYTLVWKDARGSWITYPFKYVATEGTEVTRSNYYRREGEYTVGGEDDWSYEINNINRGETTFTTQSRNKFSLTSGWVKDHENILFEDLMKSTEVYLQLPSDIKANYISEDGFLIDEFGNFITDENGNYIIIESAGYFQYIINQNELLPVVLETNNLEYGKSKNFQIYNYSTVVRVAYNDYRF